MAWYGPIWLAKQAQQLLAIWQLWSVLLVGKALKLKQFIETTYCNKSKLALYYQLSETDIYVSNETECFSYKGGCGMSALKHLKRAGLGYR